MQILKACSYANLIIACQLTDAYTDIGILSVRPSVRPSVCLSVRPSVHDVQVLDENCLTYCHNFVTIAQSF